MAFLYSKSMPFLLLASMLSILMANAQIISICFANDSFNPTFQENLNLLLSSLSSNIARMGFYNTSEGRIPSRIYGLAQCAGHVPQTACVNCINTAIAEADEVCDSRIMFRHECFLRYSNDSFFSVLDNSTGAHLVSENNVSNPARFSPFLKGMMGDLARQAAFEPSSGMFATKKSRFTGNETVHGVVQCTRDLSPNNCNKCLQDVIEEALRCCPYSRSVEVIRKSCNLRYEVPGPDTSSAGAPALFKTLSFEAFFIILSSLSWLINAISA